MRTIALQDSRPGRSRNPGDSAAFLQSRLSVFHRTMALIFVGFLAMGNVALWVVAPEFDGSRLLELPGNYIGLGASALSGLASFWFGTGVRSVRSLRFVDGAMFLLVAGAVMATGVVYPIPAHREMMMLLSLLALVLAHTAFVPSSIPFTTTLGSVAVAGAAGTSYAIHVAEGPDALLSPALGAASVVVWGVCALALSGIVAHVIYGLRVEGRRRSKVGPYTLEQKIGVGGMGEVYRASHALLKRPTAIKLIAEGAVDEKSLQRFEREVQLTSQLRHPNTITIYDYGRTAEGIFYYAMELLDGFDLDELVRLEGPQPPARVAHVLSQIGGALAEAHERGLIHRDIKPANVILTRQEGFGDVAKLLDFGLVKDLEADEGTLTRTGAVAGTPAYMAPETLTSPEAVDARSDLYALGALAYYLLTAEHVFEGGSAIDVCYQHLHCTPISPSERLGADLPWELESLVLWCLEKDPGDRPPDTAAFLGALAECDVDGPWTEESSRQRWSAWGERAPDESIIRRRRRRRAA